MYMFYNIFQWQRRGFLFSVPFRFTAPREGGGGEGEGGGGSRTTTTLLELLLCLVAPSPSLASASSCDGAPTATDTMAQTKEGSAVALSSENVETTQQTHELQQKSQETKDKRQWVVETTEGMLRLVVGEVEVTSYSR